MIRSRGCRMLARAVLCVAPIVALIGPATGAAHASEFYDISNGTNLCLDADSNHYGQNGDNAQLWGCNDHSEQAWVLYNGHIYNSNGMCLDADSNHYGQNGDNAQLWSCNNNPEQLWSHSGNGHVVNHNGMCLDADSNHAGQNGDNVQLWSCNSNEEQSWNFLEA
jgi:alpha-galactosidase